MVAQVYELTFKGEAGTTIRAAFPEFEVTATHGTTVLHGGLTDQAALHGVIERIQDLGLELIDVRLIVEETGSPP